MQFKYDYISTRSSEKAWLISIDGIERWIPKSITSVDEKANTIIVPEWFLKNMEDSGALHSDDKTRRYVLWKNWDTRRNNNALCIGLNPKQDPNAKTIQILSETLSKMNYSGLVLCNLFTVISDRPDVLAKDENIEQDLGIIFAYSLGVRDVIFCWGSFDEAKARAQKVIDFYSNGLCFGRNNDGSPWHPMSLFYAGLEKEKGRIRLFNFREHSPEGNIYGTNYKAKKKRREYNAKQQTLSI